MKFSLLSSRLLRHFPLAAVALISSAIAIAKPAQAASFTIKINPAATYLHTATTDPYALNATAIDLASLGISSGDLITLESVGDYSVWAPVGSPETGRFMFGLFSTSAELLPSQFLHRVPGAIDSGDDINISSTYIDNDIAEDFLITQESLSFQIPDLAQYLFVAAVDRHWSDNQDFNNDFALRITTEQTVPEPSTILGLLALGGLASQGLFRKKQQ